MRENPVNTVEATFFAKAAWNLVKMFFYMIYRASSNMGYDESKTRSLGKLNGKLVNTLEALFESLSECLSWWYVGQVRRWVMMSQKVGH